MTGPAPPDDMTRIGAIEEALKDPETRARVAAALAGSTPAGVAPGPWWQRHQPLLAGLASGTVVLLAFLLPSMQDQWNLYRSGKVIDQYAQIGGKLMEQGLYASAEKAFAKAVEMSEGRRLDLIESELRAHVQRVNEDPEWRGAVPEDISEGDFLYLLAMQRGEDRARDRAATLAAYGVWLASVRRITEAERQLREAIKVDASNSEAHVALGNLLDDRGELQAAEAEYRRAIELDPDDPGALYDLGDLLLATRRAKDAEAPLRKYIAINPDEAEGYRRLADCLTALGRTSEAVEMRKRASALSAESADAEVQDKGTPRAVRPDQ
jgi:tetratricopeptide (TPR) repeat protein